ncbi:hypothetical protein ACIRBY_06055 [Streptomyces sp. NPDC096136]|uniref:hypothetical protein n=1 Tax=Streptomyces sp. NPDC096136 TaxID=3366076 RepID=UPI003816F186
MVGNGINVQGGRTGHPDATARQKRAKKKPKTMALITGGVMVLSPGPSGVREFCANGEWPAALLVRDSGGGKLTWSLGQLPAGVTASPCGGSLAADTAQAITLGGRTEQQPPNGRFTIAVSGNGGTGRVTVTRA